jgi:hypothetical protein
MHSKFVETSTGVSDGVVSEKFVSRTNACNGSGEFVKLFQRNLNQPEFIQGMINVHEIVKKSGVPNFVSAKIPVFSGINCEFLDRELCDYEDRIIAQLMRFGAPIGHESGVLNSSETLHRNHSGAKLFPDDINRYLVKELKYKSVLGPFDGNPFQSSIVLSPLNSVPKANNNERRVIVDLSFPKGASVNDGIARDSYLGEKVRLEYPTVDHLVELIKLKGFETRVQTNSCMSLGLQLTWV